MAALAPSRMCSSRGSSRRKSPSPERPAAWPGGARPSVGGPPPRDYGGTGAEPDVLKSRIIAEEFTRAGAPGGLAGQGISMLVPTLLEVGSEEQKRRWIEPTLRGEVIWCQGYSEPGAGSDLANLQTRGVAGAGDFV